MIIFYLEVRWLYDGIGILPPPARGRGPAIAGRGPMESIAT